LAICRQVLPWRVAGYLLVSNRTDIHTGRLQRCRLAGAGRIRGRLRGTTPYGARKGTIMTEKEFLALVNIIEFESKSLDKFELEDKDKDKSIRKDLKIVKDFIKRHGEEIWLKNN
jgi:hypothetical protein